MVENDDLNKLDEILKFSMWVAMDMSTTKKGGLEMVKSRFSDIKIVGSFSFGDNPLPHRLSNIDTTNAEMGIKLLLEHLKDCVDFINRVIKNIEKYLPGPREEWIVHYSGTKLIDFYDLVLVLEMEIKGQFGKCVRDFVEEPGYNYNKPNAKLPDWLN